MKKGLCIVLSALMIAFSFASCGKKDVSDKPTKIDENGSAYVEVTDKDGNEVTSILSDKDKAKADKNAAKDNKNNNNTTTVDASELASKAEGAMSGFTNVDEKDIQSDKKDLIKNGTSTKKTSLRDDVIIKTSKTGKFTLKAKIKAASGENTPVTCVTNGKKFAYDMTMNGSQVRIIMDGNNLYLLLPAIKWYIKMSTDDIGLESMDDMMSNLASTEDKYVGSTKVTVNGTEYTCEEYKNSDGRITKYYFDKNNNWKRIEGIKGDEVTIMEIDSFSGKVDDSVFSLKGYTDMTALVMGQANITTTTKKS